LRFPGQLPHGGAAATLIVRERLAERGPMATSSGRLYYDALQMRISGLTDALYRRSASSAPGSSKIAIVIAGPGLERE